MSLDEKVGFRARLNNSVSHMLGDGRLAEALTSEVKMPSLHIPYGRRIAYGLSFTALCLTLACCGGGGGGGGGGHPHPKYECNDGIDNDGDGYIDMADLGCSSPTDNNEADDPLPGLDATLDSPQKYDAIVGHPVDFAGTGHSDGENIIKGKIDYGSDGIWDDTAVHNSKDITDTFQHSGYGLPGTWTATYQVETSDGRTATATLNVAVSPNGVPYVTGLDTNGDGTPDVVDADHNGVLDQVISVSAGAPFPYTAKVVCVDPDGDPVTYNSFSMPTNMSFNTGTGQITFDPDPSQVGQTPAPDFNCTDGIDTSLGVTIQFSVDP